VRTPAPNILQKLEMHSKLEAATFAMQHELASHRPNGGEVTKLARRVAAADSAAAPAAREPKTAIN
jgi:hypothetical protein